MSTLFYTIDEGFALNLDAVVLHFNLIYDFVISKYFFMRFTTKIFGIGVFLTLTV